MPIRSKAQWRMFAVKHPDLLEKWQKEAHRVFSKLPEHVKPKEKKKKR